MKQYTLLGICVGVSLVATSGHVHAAVSNFVDGVTIGTASLSPGLILDIEGKVGATEFCVEDGTECASLVEIIDGASFAESGDDLYTENAGNVGIGEPSPLEKLHVDGNLRLNSRHIYFGSAQDLYGDNSALLYFDSNDSTVTGFELRDADNTRYGLLYGDSDGANFGLLDGNGNWSYLSVLDSHAQIRANDTTYLSVGPSGVSGDHGTVSTLGDGKSGWEGYSINGRSVFMHDGATATGIYNDVDNEWVMYAVRNGSVNMYHNGANKLYTRSNGAQTVGTHYANDFLYASDRRLKENITHVSGLEVVLNLEGVSFDWKESGDSSIGFIAQEVEEVVPGLVDTDSETGYKSVRYGSVSAYLVEAVKEQQQIIERQQKQIDSLTAQLELLINQH